MNTDTGQIRDLPALREAMGLDSTTTVPEPWVEVPPHLNRAARRQMATGRAVNLAGKSGLAAFARGVRSRR